ncbi:hypothetical protein ABZZ17_23735 [Streptomyces sp. NPDC006512]|uniref:hypothetical protein n=1 Tax=Streptomyces sp. NPDC006512 TaxID=3154307 RepID=UPI0033BF015A
METVHWASSPQASGSFEGHNPIALLVIVLVGLVTAAALLGYAAGARSPRRRIAAACGAGAVGLYVWGTLPLLFLDESATFDACLKTVGRERMARVDEYRATYVPLGLECHVRDDHRSHATAVPPYVNPGVAVLLLGALGAGVSALIGVRVPPGPEDGPSGPSGSGPSAPGRAGDVG